MIHRSQSSVMDNQKAIPVSGRDSPKATRKSICSPYFELKTSPYFDDQQHKTTDSTLLLDSLKALGPLVYTWNSDLYASRTLQFCHRPRESRTICQDCRMFLKQALETFLPCPVLRSAWEDHQYNGLLYDDEKRMNQSCVELFGQAMERRHVRHLCSNQCFLRAFLPARDWVRLVTAAVLSNPQGKKKTKLNSLLSGWTCKLAGTNTRKRKGSSCTNSSSISPIETVFFNAKNQQCYFHTGDAAKAMFEFADTDSSNCRVLFYKKGPFETNCPATIRSASSQTIASPLGLLEELFSNDPWRLLLCTILLNRTQRKQGVDLILWEFLKSWPTPRSVLAGNVQEIAKRIARLGMHQKRSQGLQQFCRDYIELLENKETQEFDWSRVDITKLYHCGDYAADAYQIFIQKKWHTVNSKDYALRAYCEWKRTFQNI